jgi:hypothetical protein
MSDTETTLCPSCGAGNNPDAKSCESCRRYLKSGLECLRSIDVSLITIRRIARWWLILSILAVAVSVIYVLSQVI